MDEDKRKSFEPEKIVVEADEEKPDGTKKKTRIRIDVEDIIAIFAGIIAVIFTLGMVVGKIPVNELTIGVLSFSGVGAVISRIIGARKKKNRK